MPNFSSKPLPSCLLLPQENLVMQQASGNPGGIVRIRANDGPNIQHQEAQDQPISLAQWHRPEVQEESQACAARDDEGVGMCSRLSFVVHFSGQWGLNQVTSLLWNGNTGSMQEATFVLIDEGRPDLDFVEKILTTRVSPHRKKLRKGSEILYELV